jgi:predicted extracellular nuclease
MKRRLLWLACLFLCIPFPALASPSGVVISGFQVRGPTGGNDEYIELRNTSSVRLDISGWKLQGCSSGTPGTASTRATIGANIGLDPGQYYLFTNSASSGYSGTVTGDAAYGTGITDFSSSNYAGIQLVDAAGARQDGVGSPLSPCHEGTGLVTPTGNGSNNAYARTRDTDDNATDFLGPQAADPHNSGSITSSCQNDGVHIYTIQGRGHVSAYNGLCVSNVPGIVTQVVSNGFYMQDGDGDGNPATSDGIFVFTSSAPAVSAGQEVKVAGTVQEYRPGSTFAATNCPSSSGACNLTVTEITAPTVTPASGLFANSSVTPVIVGNGGRVPPNQIIDNDTTGSVEVAGETTYDPDQDGIDFYESLEGMQVRLNDARVVGPTNPYGEIWLVGDNGVNATGVNARGGLTLSADDDNPERVMIDVSLLTASYLQVNVGDATAQVIGALSYDFGDFRIFPQSLPSFTSGGLAPQSSTVSSGGDHLRVLSYNLENLDPNDSDVCDGAPDQDVANGRFAREGRQIAVNLGAPDILGVEEIQDNDGCTDDGVVDSTTTLNTLVQAIIDAGGPAYSYLVVDPLDDQDGGVLGGNIRQAILYNPARVTFVPGTQGAGDATTATALTADGNGRLRLTLSPGRIDPNNSAWTTSRKPLAATFDFNGRRLLMVVNHFNSKGGDEPLFGRYQPPVLSSATQRTQQAQVEHDFIAQALALDAGARIISVGDFNDFAFSTPMQTLTGQASGGPILFDLASELLAPEERYSYVYEGNSQELDHVLVSAALLPRAEVEPVHVNSEFADHVSDHDPTMASLDIAANQAPVANAGPNKTVLRLAKVALNGTRSHDPDGRIVSYLWIQTAGIEVRLNGATSATPTFRAPLRAGDLTFKLTVTDDQGARARDSVIVHVGLVSLAPHPRGQPRAQSRLQRGEAAPSRRPVGARRCIARGLQS